MNFFLEFLFNNLKKGWELKFLTKIWRQDFRTKISPFWPQMTPNDFFEKQQGKLWFRRTNWHFWINLIDKFRKLPHFSEFWLVVTFNNLKISFSKKWRLDSRASFWCLIRLYLRVFEVRSDMILNYRKYISLTDNFWFYRFQIPCSLYNLFN